MRLIDADALKKTFKNKGEALFKLSRVRDIINNAPTVEYPFYQEAYQTGYEEGKNERPQVNVIPQECIKILAETVVDAVQQIDWKALCEKMAERPQGEWIVDKRTREVVCSCCGQSRRDTRTTHIYFCNHCGAEMQKGGSET